MIGRRLDRVTMGVLALLVAVDGWRRVPAGAVVLRRALMGPWRVVPIPPGRSRFRLLSWAAPLTVTVVLPATTDPPGAGPESVGRHGARVAVLRGLGGLTALALVIGLPLASRWLGGFGFFWGAGVVLALSVTTVAVAALLGRRVSAGSSRPLSWALPLLSPFATARAAEWYLNRALSGVSPLVVARELLPPHDFAAWIRPWAFDRLRGAAPADPHLDRLLDLAALRALVDSRPLPRDGAEAFCPRCGMGFVVDRGPCPDCAVAVVRY